MLYSPCTAAIAQAIDKAIVCLSHIVLELHSFLKASVSCDLDLKGVEFEFLSERYAFASVQPRIQQNLVVYALAATLEVRARVRQNPME